MRHLWVCLFLAFSCTTAFADAQQNDEVVMISQDDNEMNQAMQQAYDSLDSFIARLQNPQAGDENFLLKVRVEDENGAEHFWVTDIAITEDGFSGVIANQAQIVKLVDYGQGVSFGKDIVSDWAYDQKGVRQGAFTLKVLLKQMPQEEADAYRTLFGWN